MVIYIYKYTTNKIYIQIEATGIEKYIALNGDMDKQLEYVYSFYEEDDELKNLPFSVISPLERKGER